jgi:hypothetical protein
MPAAKPAFAARDQSTMPILLRLAAIVNRLGARIGYSAAHD